MELNMRHRKTVTLQIADSLQPWICTPRQLPAGVVWQTQKEVKAYFKTGLTAMRNEAGTQRWADGTIRDRVGHLSHIWIVLGVDMRLDNPISQLLTDGPDLDTGATHWRVLSEIIGAYGSNSFKLQGIITTIQTARGTGKRLSAKRVGQLFGLAESTSGAQPQQQLLHPPLTQQQIPMQLATASATAGQPPPSQSSQAVVSSLPSLPLTNFDTSQHHQQQQQQAAPDVDPFQHQRVPLAWLDDPYYVPVLGFTNGPTRALWEGMFMDWPSET